MFQSPSLRGSGRFLVPRARAEVEARVSIPFIAGQWSLLTERPPPPKGGGRVSIPFIAGQWSLPSPGRRRRGCWRPRFQSPSLRGSGRFRAIRLHFSPACRVSIPFIAGQWSLRSPQGGGAKEKKKFQSPSLRGSGRFERPRRRRDRGHRAFQSPSLRGSGRFSQRSPAPFGAERFQSPSLRGSGRF